MDTWCCSGRAAGRDALVPQQVVPSAHRAGGSGPSLLSREGGGGGLLWWPNRYVINRSYINSKSLGTWGRLAQDLREAVFSGYKE